MTDCHSVIIREANPFAGTQQTTRATMIKYPFPLREGVLAALDLPSDMTKREAKRLCAFIDSLGIEEQGQLNPGPPASSSGI
ncbi:MAG: hypothetical protein H0U92_00415 [Actinobacteria bacterium]|nr:hypothetical protein [Actinomycetota bacterium]